MFPDQRMTSYFKSIMGEEIVASSGFTEPMVKDYTEILHPDLETEGWWDDRKIFIKFTSGKTVFVAYEGLAECFSITPGGV